MGERKQEEWARWRGLVSEQQESGQSIAGFCRERVLPVWQFYEWKKRLHQTETGSFVTVEVGASKAATTPTPQVAMSSSPIEIGLRDDRRLPVGPDPMERHAIDPQLYLTQLLVNLPSLPSNQLVA